MEVLKSLLKKKKKKTSLTEKTLQYASLKYVTVIKNTAQFKD